MAGEALIQLSAELKAGKSEALLNYLAGMSRYSWNNVLLIASQRPNATHVAGIHAWNGLGRTLKKGEKGIAILAPIIVKRDPDADRPEPNGPDSRQLSRVAGFRRDPTRRIQAPFGRDRPCAATLTRSS